MVSWKVDGSDDWMVLTMVAMKDPSTVGQKALLKCLACVRVLPMVSEKVDGSDDWMVSTMVAMKDPSTVGQKA